MTPRTIVIVGAGPAGCYAAQALAKTFLDAHITIMERLPVPYGLLRYGVAADHQGTKAVQKQFDRLFLNPNVSFAGGIECGRDVSLTQLTEIFDVVVLATGLRRDRTLSVDGDALGGVVGAGRVTRALNSHPEEQSLPPVVSQNVAIVGSGNVAVDVLRLLCRGDDEWNGSDMDPDVLDAIIPRSIREIHVISRSSATDARWDPAMLRELGKLRRPKFYLSSGEIEGGLYASELAISDLLATEPRSSDLSIHLHLSCTVESLSGQERVEAIRIRTPTGACRSLATDTVVTAIGFEHQLCNPLPSRVYATGWLKTGPQGTISFQRVLAKELVEEIVADLSKGLIGSGRPGLSALELDRIIDFAGWLRIDSLERAQATEGRARRKIRDIQRMNEIATDGSGSRVEGATT